MKSESKMQLSPHPLFFFVVLGVEPRAYAHQARALLLSLLCLSATFQGTRVHNMLAELALVSFFFLEHKFSARWTKVMGTAEWKASRTRRW